jgi:hypothetical protein
VTQSGFIPTAARSVQFLVQENPSSLSVSLNGVAIPIFQLPASVLGAVYGADISAFAGTTASLTFTEGPGTTLIDDISFSSQSVPEAGTMALTGLGGLAMACLARKRPQ